MLESDIICPQCHKHYDPDDIDPANDDGYVVGQFICNNCRCVFEIKTFSVYRITKLTPNPATLKESEAWSDKIPTKNGYYWMYFIQHSIKTIPLIVEVLDNVCYSFSGVHYDMVTIHQIADTMWSWIPQKQQSKN